MSAQFESNQSSGTSLNELLWEQSVSDGNFVGANTHAVNALEDSIDQRNTDALYEIAFAGQSEPSDTFAYLKVWLKLNDIDGNVTLRDDTRAAARGVIDELEEDFPQLHAEAMAQLKEQTNQLIVASGMGKPALKTIIVESN